MLKGIDISVYQKSVDFSSLKEKGVDFVFIRSSYGAPDPGHTTEQYTDAWFARNRDEVRRAGITHGFYHFAYPQVNTAKAEAEHFLKVVGDLQVGEMVVLDFEQPHPNPPEWCSAFLRIVREATGVHPFIYLNLATIQRHDWSAVAEHHPLWLARWDNNPASAPPTLNWPAGIPLRQYGLVDFMYADGNVAYESLEKYGKQAPPPPVVEIPIEVQHSFKGRVKIAALRARREPNQNGDIVKTVGKDTVVEFYDFRVGSPIDPATMVEGNNIWLKRREEDLWMWSGGVEYPV